MLDDTSNYTGTSFMSSSWPSSRAVSFQACIKNLWNSNMREKLIFCKPSKTVFSQRIKIPPPNNVKRLNQERSRISGWEYHQRGKEVAIVVFYLVDCYKELSKSCFSLSYFVLYFHISTVSQLSLYGISLSPFCHS